MDDIYFYLFLAIIFYLGFITGENITFFRLQKAFYKLAESAGIDIDKELDKIKEHQKEKQITNIVHHLHAETHGDMIYLWDKEKDDFICQAKTIEELAYLAKQYKNINGAVVQHENKIFLFANGLVKEHNFQ